jgi:hypothetical protein
MGLLSIFNNIRKRGLKDVTNPERIRMYRTGQKIKRDGLILSYDEIIPYAEQLVYRVNMCNDCLKAGSCKICGCDMPSAMMTPQFECEDGKFIPMFTKIVEKKDGRGNVHEIEMIDAEAWEEYKNNIGLTFNFGIKL